jgi:hypothetical protein
MADRGKIISVFDESQWKKAIIARKFGPMQGQQVA